MKKLKPKEKFAIRMYYGGHSREECIMECGLSKYKFAKILESESGKKYCAKIENELEHDLKSLQGQYVKVLREGMSSGDNRERLATASLYQKSPLFAASEGENNRSSAEDLVKQMIETPQAEIPNKGTKLLHFDVKKIGTTNEPV